MFRMRLSDFLRPRCISELLTFTSCEH
jgi:hypothetical protein